MIVGHVGLMPSQSNKKEIWVCKLYLWYEKDWYGSTEQLKPIHVLSENLTLSPGGIIYSQVSVGRLLALPFANCAFPNAFW